ncbi:efflux transporter periplasmic adaptor subunit [Elizabethkingia anophelis]|nr:efflux transporter periplasmic adaptor subunit [Elizabethkingia anophelis]MDV3862917.1 efflux transporter periplasmic adaptor subunit [Elizabethkingia anophelis]MDV3908006.1 efflux transporter periplasmic adaptor subunit [Elizabethkingia anophelis]MDV3924462.1 efflux transporter periplasmic adaptor subunit [Elizabethkingia anophelis]MDV3990062.1 efflux transporter periplasmic adaptor subunit [Elizabethkingia anophelis]
MKFTINKISLLATIVVLVFAFSACSNHKEGDGHDHGTKEEPKKEEAHEEETPTIATLTEEQIKTVGIQLGTVEQKELTATIRANGLLKVPNNNKANATSLYGGVIKTLKVQIGDYVKKGQVIATIANPQFIQLQEEYLSTASRITFAEQELARQKELNQGNAGAGKNLQSATAELNSLRTRRASLQQQIQLMGINPSSVSNSNLRSALVVTSPLNGTVSNVFAKIGSYADVSSPVIEIVDNSSLHLDLQVFEKDLPQVKVGQTIHFTITNNPSTEYDATVFSIGSSFENDSKTIAVHCRVNGNKKGLIDGMNITGIVSLSNVTTPAVPNEAVVNADGKYYIFVQTDKKAEEHHEEGEEAHEHKEGEEKEHSEDKTSMNFEKIEVLKGVSDMGYTAINFVNEIPANAKIVVKGAFFVNAKLSNTGGHEH